MRPGQPSRTAWGAAVHRAVHQTLEGGRVFRDPLAWPVLGDVDRERLLAAAEGRRPLRLFIAVRHRFAEDAVAAAYRRGVRQVVVLGAGLDTFAYRQAYAGLRVLEVDHPDTAAWKRDRLHDAGIAVPESVGYVGVDFERDDLRGRLVEGGLDGPAVHLWLGVVPYLTRAAVAETLRTLAHPGGEVVLDYPSGPLDSADPVRADLRRRTEAAGEPMRSSFEPAELRGLLHEVGFDEVEDLGRAEILPRFLGVPAGGAGGGGHVVRARRTD